MFNCLSKLRLAIRGVQFILRSRWGYFPNQIEKVVLASLSQRQGFAHGSKEVSVFLYNADAVTDVNPGIIDGSKEAKREIPGNMVLQPIESRRFGVCLYPQSRT